MPNYHLCEAIVNHNMVPTGAWLSSAAVSASNQKDALQYLFVQQYNMTWRPLEWFDVPELYVISKLNQNNVAAPHVLYAAIDAKDANNYQKILERKFNNYLSLLSAGQIKNPTLSQPQTPKAKAPPPQKEEMKFAVTRMKDGVVIGYIESTVMPTDIFQDQPQSFFFIDLISDFTQHFQELKAGVYFYRDVNKNTDCCLWYLPNNRNNRDNPGAADYMVSRTPEGTRKAMLQAIKSKANNFDIDPLTQRLMASALPQHGKDYCIKCSSRNLGFVSMALVCKDCKSFVGGA